MAVEVNGMLVAAHELKAPLSLMRQLALAINFADETTCQRYRSQLINVSERALRQVNDLVKIARLEDGFFETEPVSVRGVCEAVLSELSPFFRIEGRSIDLEFHNKSRLAVANHDLLYSIVYNFCVNAIHYSERGSVSEMVISERRSRLRISVRDYGPALPTKVWRELNAGGLDRPTEIAMRPGSSGLGLYIASQFAAHMRAQIGAVRHRDGASFYVDLPISKQISFNF